MNNFVQHFTLRIFLLCLFLLCGCKTDSGNLTFVSPSGKYILTTSVEESRQDLVNFGCVVIEIKDQSGRVVHRENTRAADHQRWSIRWLSDQKFELNSSDIGIYTWVTAGDGVWVKQ